MNNNLKNNFIMRKYTCKKLIKNLFLNNNIDIVLNFFKEAILEK